MNVLLGAINTYAITMTWAMSEKPASSEESTFQHLKPNRNKSVITLDDTDQLHYL
ncbi:hypothetical protein Bca4012_024522 [Brassica carinata]